MKNIINIDSITQVHNFLGLPKPKHPLISVIPIDDRMTQMDYGDFTYVLNFYQISLKSGIRGNLTYGRNSYDFEEGSMIFMQPGQTLKVENNEDVANGEGWTLIFRPDLITKSTLGKTIEDYSFFSYGVSEALHLSDEEKLTITDLVKKIEKEYNQNIDKHSQKLIISNIELILDYCTRFYDRQFFTRTNLNQNVVSKFEQELKGYFKSEKISKKGLPNSQYFGEVLHFSPNYLSDLLKKETGKSIKDHVDSYVVKEAKKILLNSNQTVSEVAYLLGYEYPQSFSRLFTD